MKEKIVSKSTELQKLTATVKTLFRSATLKTLFRLVGFDWDSMWDSIDWDSIGRTKKIFPRISGGSYKAFSGTVALYGAQIKIDIFLESLDRTERACTHQRTYSNGRLKEGKV